MENGDNILDAIFEEDHFEDVEMVDVEEGEFQEHSSRTEMGHSMSGDVNVENLESVGINGLEEGEVLDHASQAEVSKHSSGDGSVGNQGSQSKNSRRRANKKRNKKKKNGPLPKVTDINRFVLDACRRLKEKKSYMVYTAVGCLGISALSDIVREVDAIQSCGGQMTADGKRYRTGGGVLWSIIKVREPAAYREIMKKAKEFEKQFRQQNLRQATNRNTEGSSKGSSSVLTNEVPSSINPDGAQPVPQKENEQPSSGGERKSVHERIRVPVSYDDLDQDHQIQTV